MKILPTEKRPPNRLARRVLTTTLLFSLVLTALFTVFQAIMEYRMRISIVENNMEQIENIYRKAIAASLWNFDENILVAQIDGILQMPYMNYAAVIQNGRTVCDAGTRRRMTKTREIPLTYNYRKKEIPLGTLIIQSDTTNIVEEVVARIAMIFLFQFATVAVTVSFLFWLFNRLVTNHLYALANYFNTQTVAIDHISEPFRLNKKNQNDEIDVLVNSFNGMRENLALSYRELRESRDRYSNLYNQTPVLLHSVDGGGKLVDVNDFWLKTLGYERHEVLGRQVADFLSDTSRTYARDVVEPAFSRDGFCKDIRYQLLRKSGEPVEVLLSAMGERDKEGAIIRSLAVSQDITDRIALENQLLQAQKMEAVGQLAGGVAHDFNNILCAIQGYATLSLMKMDRNDRNRENLEQIMKSSERAAILTQNLLAFSRKQMINVKFMDLNEIIQRFEEFLRRLLREDIELKTTYAERRLPVLADFSQIEQVLMNLVTNARDAMPNGGQIVVTTDLVTFDQSFVEAHGFGEPGEYAVISVFDSGCGMTENIQKRIFEPFYTTKEQGKGTGLGLSMVYGIVKKHKGHITVNSQTGSGTTFTIYLPVSEPSISEQQSREEMSPLRGGNETILLAEDDEALRRMTAKVISDYGYTVIEAVNGSDAVAKFAAHAGTVRLVVLDGIMPKMNGKEAWQEIKRLDPGVKAIFVSGYAEDIFTKKGIPDQEAVFVQKPMSPFVLLSTMRTVLDSAR